MAELQKLMESSDAFKSELLQTYLSSPSSLSSSSISSLAPAGSQSLPLSSTTTDNSSFIDNTGTGSLQGNTQTTTSDTGNLPTTDPCGNVQGGTDTASQAVSQTPSTTPSVPLTSPGGPRASDPNANVGESASARLLARVEGALSDSQRLLVDYVSEAVVQSHYSTCINTHARVAQASLSLDQDSPAVSDPSKLTSTASTMWQQFTSNMAPEIGKAVAFCKSLPGFGELEPEDQMNLIKQGSFEVMLARFSMLVDHVKETMMDPGHKMKCPKEVILAMPMGDFLKEFFPIAARFNPLGLTDGEIGLFTSILFICPDRAGLKNKETVGKIQHLLLLSLYSLMKRNHAEFSSKFVKLMNTILVFREVNEKHSKALMGMKQKSPENYSEQFPSLHREVFN